MAIIRASVCSTISTSRRYSKRRGAVTLALSSALLLPACAQGVEPTVGAGQDGARTPSATEPATGGPRTADVSDVVVPAGLKLEVAAEGLTYATAVAFDDAGTVYIAEAGGVKGKPLEFLFTPDTHQRLLRGRSEPVQPLVRITPHVAAEGFVFGTPAFGVPADDIILAEFGTVVTYQAEELPGFRVQRIDLDSGEATDFLVNKSGKPASAVRGDGGLERPIQLEYAPDGNLYLVDFGVIDVDQNGLKAIPGTGVVWRLTRST
jgi:hypothetical protein